MNPFGIGLTFYNNWLQKTNAEFIMLSFEIGKDEEVVWITGGIAGFGFYLCKSL